jgi:hypothetical protein
MKTIALIFAVLGVSFSAFAQAETNVKKNDLTGPAYKNYKVWLDKSEPTKIYSESNKTPLVGPDYKNRRFSANSSEKELVVVKASDNERLKLTGPDYKNHGPWSRKAK